MNSTLVSVIIPTYNSERFIEETLRSVRNQTHTKIEVLIIDDGSTDRQKEFIMPVCGTDDRFKYYYQSNKGVSEARNWGYSLSSGAFIAFLDADDIWLPDNLSVKLQKFASGDFGLVHSDAEVIDVQSHSTGAHLKGNEGRLLNAMLSWKETQIPGPSSILVKREVIDQVGTFDQALSTAADQDFFFRVAAVSAIGRVDKVTWNYRIHSTNMHKNIGTMERDVLYLYEKARKNGFFYSRNFARQCFANMYLILAASWAGDGHNLKRALLFGSRAFLANPFIIFSLAMRIAKRWRH